MFGKKMILGLVLAAGILGLGGLAPKASAATVISRPMPVYTPGYGAIPVGAYWPVPGPVLVYPAPHLVYTQPYYPPAAVIGPGWHYGHGYHNHFNAGLHFGHR